MAEKVPAGKHLLLHIFPGCVSAFETRYALHQYKSNALLDAISGERLEKPFPSALSLSASGMKRAVWMKFIVHGCLAP